MRHALIAPLLLVATLPWIAIPGDAHARAVRPLDAGRVADGIGVNTHLTYTRSVYADQAKVTQALLSLGVKHIRDVMAAESVGVGPGYNALLRRLADRHGIRFLLHLPRPPLPGSQTTAQLVASVGRSMRGRLDGLEGPNEYDVSGVPNWPGALRALQRDVRAAMAGSQALSRVPLIGPAMGHTDSWAAGSLAGLAEIGNTHPYPGSHRPGDWTMLEPHLRLSRQVSGPRRPQWATELGYHNALADTTTFEPVSERAAGAYLPQLLLVGAQRGLRRQYVYELLDDGPEPAGRQRDRHFGLFRADYSPKPAAIAVGRLTRLLRGRPGSAPRGALDFRTRGASDLATVLLRRSDGAFVLAMWRDVPLWDRARRVDLTPPPISVEVGFRRRVDVRLQRLLGDGAPRRVASRTRLVRVQVAADDTTMLVVRPTRARRR